MSNELIDQFPIAIEYGCHTIELKKSESAYCGYTYCEEDSDKDAL